MNDIVRRADTAEAYQDWQIAVDLPDRDIALANLLELDPDEEKPCATLGDSEPRLDLGLIELLDVKRTADKIREKYGADRPAREPDSPDVVTVIEGLRHHIAKKQSGWEIRMGLNRHTETIGGLPHIGTGGWYYPTTVNSISEFPPDTVSEGRDVRVGVIDSVVFPNKRLVDRFYVLESSSILQPADHYSWLNGHSAFVAGLILQRAPAAKLEIRGVLDGRDSTATVWEVAKAMARFLAVGVGVLNLSIGCYTADGKAPFVLERAVDVLNRQGIVMVAAAGNHGASGATTGIKANSPIFPAACPGATAVGALEVRGGQFYRAPFTPDVQWLNLVAPGMDVVSTYLQGKVQFHELPGIPLPLPADADFPGIAKWSGTSFAAATVTGEIARIIATGKTPRQALDELVAQDPQEHEGVGKYLPDMAVLQPHEQQ
ncbi:MAG: S8 family peptidase [Actinophytocola sp.]|uniref:S8 family peptidase n=1 Tax=Actinophytocola sp. TaxID=1872138 RepID=UPI003D6AEC0F